MTENINPSLDKLAVPVSGLKPDPSNARKHEQRSIDSIKASLTEYGQQKPIVVLNTGVVIAGNGTLEAAKQLGWQRLAVVKFADAKKAKAYALADNRTAELSSWDDAQLAKTLDELSQLPAWDPASVGFTDDEMMKLLAEAEVGLPAEVTDNTPPPGAPVPSSPSSAPDAPASHVRMVQLFFDVNSHPRFMAAAKELARQYGTTNVTDTVLRCLEDVIRAQQAPTS